MIKKYLVGFMIFNLLVIPVLTLGYEGNIGVDNKADLYRFETDDITELLDETTDLEHLTVEQMDSYYTEISDDLVKADSVSKPKNFDFTGVDFNPDKYTLDLYFLDEPEIEHQEAVLFFVWSKNHLYVGVLTENISNYFDISDNSDIAIRDFIRDKDNENCLTLERVSKTFNDEQFVKGIFIYLEAANSEYAVVDLFTNEKAIQLYLILIIVIIVLIIAVIYIYIKRKGVL